MVPFHPCTIFLVLDAFINKQNSPFWLHHRVYNN